MRAAFVSSYTDARCSSCSGVVARFPGTVTTRVQIRASGYVPQQGITVRCRKCRSYVEIIWK